MSETDVRLELLVPEDKEQFVLDNQEAFNYGAMEEFGLRDDSFEEGNQIISENTILNAIEGGIAYRIWQGNEKVGGLVIRINGQEGELELLFVSPCCHTRGIGYAAWCEVEKKYWQVKKWTTCTPYFEKRNIHFYVNKCGFHIVEFFNKFHPDPNDPESGRDEDNDFDGMFRFEKLLP